jgi:hypothetical protein
LTLDEGVSEEKVPLGKQRYVEYSATALRTGSPSVHPTHKYGYTPIMLRKVSAGTKDAGQSHFWLLRGGGGDAWLHNEGTRGVREAVTGHADKWT